MKKEQPKVIVDEELIRSEAATSIDRELTSAEIEEVLEYVNGGIQALVLEAIEQTVEETDLLGRSGNVIDFYPRYELFWKNPNAWQDTYESARVFRSKEDAIKYAESHFDDPGCEWFVRLDDGGAGDSKEVAHGKIPL